MTVAYLLAIRTVFNLILFIVTLSGAIACFVSKKNGITRILGTTAFFASLYVGNVILTAVMDSTLTVEYWNLAVTALLTISVLWLGIRILKDD